ncbi:hypothetical protein [Herbaspirillum sp. CAH-3]|nr:hypothetical protein [Herbaspirillum sp. CAH-3]
MKNRIRFLRLWAREERKTALPINTAEKQRLARSDAKQGHSEVKEKK